MNNIQINKYYYSLPIKTIFFKNLNEISDTFYKIYYGFDRADKIFKGNIIYSNRISSEKEKQKFIQKNKIKNGKKINRNTQYQYSLVEIKNPKDKIFNRIFSLYERAKNFVGNKYNKSDTKILISDFSTSLDNIKFNSRFYLNTRFMQNILHLFSFSIISSTSRSLKIINNDYFLSINKIKSIPDLENKIKYLYKLMLRNNFLGLGMNNKSFCNESTLLLLKTLYSKNKKYPIFVDLPSLISSKINGKEIKYIQFKINVTEFNIKTNRVEKNTYLIEINRNPDKNSIKNLGHNLQISNIQLIESNFMLI